MEWEVFCGERAKEVHTEMAVFLIIIRIMIKSYMIISINYSPPMPRNTKQSHRKNVYRGIFNRMENCLWCLSGKKEKAEMIFWQKKVHDDEPMCRAGTEMQTQRMDLSRQGKETLGIIELAALPCKHCHV